MSKAALNMAGATMAHELKSDQVRHEAISLSCGGIRRRQPTSRVSLIELILFSAPLVLLVSGANTQSQNQAF